MDGFPDVSGGGTVFTEEKKIVRMCLSCLSVQRPDRGSSVFEGGHYFLNFKGCVQCGAIQQLEIRHREVDETEPDDPEFEETIHFNHVCKECGHLVSQHFYSFRIVGPKQEYFMDCNLCGKAEDSQWILNEDAMKDIHPEHISQLERGDLGEEEGGEIVINEIDAARLIELVNLNAIPSEGENPCAEGEVDSDWE